MTEEQVIYEVKRANRMGNLPQSFVLRAHLYDMARRWVRENPNSREAVYHWLPSNYRDY